MAKRPSRVAKAADERTNYRDGLGDKNGLGTPTRDTTTVPAGKSILELMWDELDALMEILMAPADFNLEENLAWYKGRANGLATCIALVHNPYVPDVVAVRALAKERYEQALAGESVTPLTTRP
jgi:hypothetical protein